MLNKLKITPALFVLSLLLFLLPWVNVSCGGQTVVSISGFEMVTGTQVSAQSQYGRSRSQKVETEPIAILLLLVTIAGLIGFTKFKNIYMIEAILGAVGIILMIVLQLKLNVDAGKERFGLSWQFAYWLNLFVYIGIAVISLIKFPKKVDDTLKL